MEVRKFPERGSYISFHSGRPGGQVRWYVRAMIDEFWRKVHIRNIEVLAIYEVFEVAEDEFLGLRQRHSSLGINLGLHRTLGECSYLCAGSAFMKLRSIGDQELLKISGRMSSDAFDIVGQFCTVALYVVFLKVEKRMGLPIRHSRIQ